MFCDPSFAPASPKFVARRQRVGAWLVSLVLHALALVLLGLWMTHVVRQVKVFEVALGEAPSNIPLDDRSPDHGSVVMPHSRALGATDSSAAHGLTPGAADDAAVAPLELLPADAERTSPAPTTKSFADTFAAEHDALRFGQRLAKGGGLGGRIGQRRAQLATSGGGSAASEAAVERGLKWLLAHQHKDGGWRFQFEGPPCDNLCRHPGLSTSTTAATALALLPFYGAGYTHNDGPYKEQVSRGLYYLCGRMLVTPQGGDMQEGTMYAQGLSAIALCEAYAMSKDEHLRPYAQRAIDFILYSQDRRGGGWRYHPGEPGDTTVTGWQLMALKSAQMAGLEVYSHSFFLADRFLDSVQADRGAAYGYLRPGDGAATSAVGLLCRMYLGWGRNHPALTTGIARLDKLGPSPTDLYFNYYATQVLFHHSGPAWDRWNPRLREHLISTQAETGHEAGSWHFADPHGDKGGRLYSTAMAILALEVYYRYLPLFGTRAVDEGF